MKYYIYVHTRKDNGLPFYVGKGCGRRAWSCSGRNKMWRDIVSVYGFEVRIIFKTASQEVAFSKEVKAIRMLSKSNILANIAKGGAGGTSKGYTHPDEIRDIISKAQTGRAKTEDHKEKLRQANIGKKLSEHTKRKMSQSRMGRNGLNGTVKSESHKMALSMSVLGVKKANNKSGFVGVYYHKSAKKWAASITISKKAIHLGLFDTPGEASIKYQSVKCEVMKERNEKWQ